MIPDEIVWLVSALVALVPAVWLGIDLSRSILKENCPPIPYEKVLPLRGRWLNLAFALPGILALAGAAYVAAFLVCSVLLRAVAVGAVALFQWR